MNPSESTNSQARPGRYILLLQDGHKRTVKKAQDDLSMNLVSSKELSGEVRLSTIMDKQKGVIFKNLGIAIVDDIEKEQLEHMATQTNSILYWEEDREYHAIGAMEDFRQLQETALKLQEQINAMEPYLQEIGPDPDSRWANATWGLKAIGIGKSRFTGKGVNVAILDTGFFAAHPDFVGRNVIGRSFIQGQAWDLDGNGHGTHCTGTATGFITSQDSKRYGVAYESNILIGKVLSDAGSGSTSGIVDAMDWALEKKAQVISMSLGSRVDVGQKPSRIFEQAGRRAMRKGCLVVAAAGNDSKRPNVIRPVGSPANAESIMAVGALDKNLKVAWFSNGGINIMNGGRVDLAAPGMDVFSSSSPNAPGGSLYRRLDGTSMATPHVAGVAALYFEAFPNLSAAEIWLKLEKGARNLPNQLPRDVGQGLVQAI